MRLAELQPVFACALLDGAALPSALFAPGPLPLREALKVHRDTLVGGVVRALALTFPTVFQLLGPDLFEEAAAVFAAARPPTRARLDEYGEGFAEFLNDFPPTAAIACLADVARLDLAIDRAAAGPTLSRLLRIDDTVALSAPISLRVLWLTYPADLIRDALDPTMAPQPRRLAVWRKGQGAAVLPLGVQATLFLEALLRGRPAEEALAGAVADTDPEAALLAIQAEVFAAPFAVITPAPCEQG